MVKCLADAHVSFNGGKVCRSMVSTINMFRETIDAKALAALRRIERKHGREVFSNGYWKLSRVVHICCDAAKSLGYPAASLVTYVLQYVDFLLRMENEKPSDITVVWLDKSRDGTPGAVPVALARMEVIAYVAGLVEDMRTKGVAKTVVSDMDAILPNFPDYIAYEAAFLPSDAVQAETDPDSESLALALTQGNEEQANSSDAVEAFKQTHTKTKVGTVTVDFLYDLLAGAHDEKFKAPLKEYSLKEMNWAELDLAPLKELGRQVNLQRTVELEQSEPPNASARALRRYASETDGLEGSAVSDMVKERAEASSRLLHPVFPQ